MKVTSDNYNPNDNFLAILDEISREHDIFFTSEIEGQFFIYKPVGRKTFKFIDRNVELTPFEKEDLVCKEVLLYPRNYDFDNCLAGIPTALYADIIEKSFLKSVDQFAYLIEQAREETQELDSQMTLIISEAFPNYSLEEIEDWNMFKFCKTYAQAEWKMKALRSATIQTDLLEELKNYSEMISEEDDGNIYEEEESIKYTEPQTSPKKKKMTPEQEKAYREAVAKFPEIQWEKDAGFEGFDEKASTSFSTVSPALRPGWGR